MGSGLDAAALLVCWCRYGFIVYTTRESAERAVVELAGRELDGFAGRKVNVRSNFLLLLPALGRGEVTVVRVLCMYCLSLRD